MSESAVDRLMQERRKTVVASPGEEGKFYSVLNADGLVENFLELQFRNGLCTCFNYSDLQWFSWDPEGGYMDFEFGGYLITVRGRGLYPGLFQGIKSKRVAWVREASTEMQDHDGNDSYISEISILPPGDFAGGGEGA